MRALNEKSIVTFLVKALIANSNHLIDQEAVEVHRKT